MKKELGNAYARLKHFKNKWGLCWCALAIRANEAGEKYCPGIYNLKAPIMSPKQFGMYHK